MNPSDNSEPVQLSVPGSRCLTESVERLVQAQYLAGVVRVDEAERLLYKHRLLELSVEECKLYVHVMDMGLPSEVPDYGE